jgi:hypothetical protein
LTAESIPAFLLRVVRISMYMLGTHGALTE